MRSSSRLGAAAWVIVGVVGLVEPARAEWKNLEILPKTISKPELKKIMKAQSKALGVECDFCHDAPDMASEKIEKKKIPG